MLDATHPPRFARRMSDPTQLQAEAQRFRDDFQNLRAAVGGVTGVFGGGGVDEQWTVTVAESVSSTWFVSTSGVAGLSPSRFTTFVRPVLEQPNCSEYGKDVVPASVLGGFVASKEH